MFFLGKPSLVDDLDPVFVPKDGRQQGFHLPGERAILAEPDPGFNCFPWMRIGAVLDSVNLL
jgi:hypothetical protein